MSGRSVDGRVTVGSGETVEIGIQSERTEH
jgi:hypothetical protein